MSAKQQQQFYQIGPIYQAWNQRLNLVSRNDIGHIYLKHILHALSIAKVVSFKPNTRILDVGTGGGFPGIPLAILFPQAQFHLIDSIGKKIRAVQHIAEELALSNVSTDKVRAEHVVAQYDFVLGRAVTNLNAFYGWVKDNISGHSRHDIPNGILYLRGEEAATLPMQHACYAIRDFFDEPFFERKQLVHLSNAVK
ncbi:MAG: 16S rRNA (guanine(527)-N(7))-methyltransferase RsmG [Bacteroidota bacterium]